MHIYIYIYIYILLHICCTYVYVYMYIYIYIYIPRGAPESDRARRKPGVATAWSDANSKCTHHVCPVQDIYHVYVLYAYMFDHAHTVQIYCTCRCASCMCSIMRMRICTVCVHVRSTHACGQRGERSVSIISIFEFSI